MNREIQMRETYYQLEQDVNDVIAGRKSLDSFPVNLGKRLDDFGKEIERTTSLDYLAPMLRLNERLLEHTRSAKLK